ncbi:hypothetical protein QJS66_05780 [Kocuria rhizophila]|nr:hypothetical protein QJS66_05780 [Kocuria rhizophila]
MTSRSRSPPRPSATPTSRCWPRGCAPRPARGPPGLRPPAAGSASVEAWGGAAYDVALRLPEEAPGSGWLLREAMPNVHPMLLRGRNTVGYTPYPWRSPTRSSRRPRRRYGRVSTSSTR